MMKKFVLLVVVFTLFMVCMTNAYTFKDCSTSGEPAECEEFYKDNLPYNATICSFRKKVDRIANTCTFNAVNSPSKGATADQPGVPNRRCKPVDKVKNEADRNMCKELCEQGRKTTKLVGGEVTCRLKQEAYVCKSEKLDKTKFCGCGQLADRTKVKEGQQEEESCG